MNSTELNFECIASNWLISNKKINLKKKKKKKIIKRKIINIKNIKNIDLMFNNKINKIKLLWVWFWWKTEGTSSKNPAILMENFKNIFKRKNNNFIHLK